MSALTPDAWAHASRGRWLVEPAGPLAGASIDSRTLSPGQVFFALPGANTDGHAFAAAAADAGANAVVIEDPAAAQGLPRGVGAMIVQSVPRALSAVATARRLDMARRGTVVVGVTGSNGKTTTVRLIHAALAADRRAHRPEKSFNNDLGLPLTILNAPPDARVVVCEMGISRPGDMARLASVAMPDVGVVTSIGPAHLEALGSLEGVAREKSGVFAGPHAGHALPRTAVYPRGIEGEAGAIVARAASLAAGSLVRIAHASDIDARHDAVAFSSAGTRFTVPLPGAHNALNAAVAVEVARALGVPDAVCRAGLESAEAAPMRLSRQRVALACGGAALVINDAYNANPASMLAALAVLAAQPVGPGGRRVAVVGDMLELGQAAPDEHRRIGDAIAQTPGLAAAVCVGPLMGFAAERLGRAWGPARVTHVPRLDDASAPAVAATIRDGDTVLLKASRGVALERVLEALTPAPARGLAG